MHKLMSLTGIFPIGFFMFQHLIANSYSLRGEVPFNTVVSAFGYLPFVALMEWGIVFIPIIFHAIYGLFIVAEMQSPLTAGNVAPYNYTRNWLYALQRYSGIVALGYIGWHTYSTWGIKKIFELQQSHEAGFRAISYDAMMWRFASPWYTLIYVVGITAASFHLANGLFNFGIRWGITIGAAAQKIAAVLWSGVGVALTIIGVWTSLNFYVLAHKPLEKFGNQTVTERFATLDDLVREDKAPANPTPTAKPVDGPGGVLDTNPQPQPGQVPSETAPTSSASGNTTTAP